MKSTVKRLALILPAVLVLLVAGAFVAINSGYLTPYLEKEILKRTSVKVELSRVELLGRWPLTLKVGAGKAEDPAFTVEWKILKLEAARLTPPYRISLEADMPIVRLNSGLLDSSGPQSTSATPGKDVKAAPPPAVNLRLSINNGSVEVGRFRVSGLQASLEQKRLLQSSASLRVKAVIEDRELKLKIPVEIDGPNVTVTRDSVKAEELNTSVAGLKADLRGGSLFKDDRHRWKVVISAKDMSQLPSFPLLPMATSWTGQVDFKAEALKDGPGKPWQVDAELEARKVSALIDLIYEQSKIKGRFSADLKAQVQYHGQEVVIPSFDGLIESLDFTASHPDWVEPGPVFPVRLEFKGRGDPKGVSFEILKFAFWKFKSSASGTVGLAAPFPANISLEVDPVSLEGLEDFVIPLKGSPVNGTLALRGKIQGPLGEPERAHILLTDLKFKNFSAVANLSQEKFKLRGPVSGSLEGSAEIQQNKILSAAFRGFLNLKRAGVAAANLQKAEGREMALDFAVKNQGDLVVFEKFQLNSFVGRIGLTGTARNVFDPTVDLDATLGPLSLTELRIAMPPFHDTIPPGEVSGRLKLKGKMETERPWHDWPLTVMGGVDVKQDRYTLTATAPPNGAPAKSAPTVPGGPAGEKSEAFLPRGRLTSALDVTIKYLAGEIVKDDQSFKNVSASGRLAGGKFSGDVKIGGILEGSADLKNLSVPLLTPGPELQGFASWKNIDIEKALQFMKPEYKDFAKGRIQGTADFQTVMPSEPKFMEQLKVKGQATLMPVTFSTVKVGEVINDLIKKIPAAKIKPAKVEPLSGQLSLNYAMAAQVLQIENLKGQDADGSEITLRGKVMTESLRGDLIGEFRWAKPTVQGCLLQGNADASGRMIVPLALKGNLLKPEYAMLTDLAAQIGQKTLECEAKKMIDKAKEDGGKKLEEEIKKKLKGIFGK